MTKRGQPVPWKRTQAVEDRLDHLRIDDVDLDLLESIPRWRPDSRGYVTRTVIQDDGSRMAEYLHRTIMERILGRSLSFQDKVDHRDRDPLNNQRDNLRLSTNSQNIMNSPPRNGKRFKGTTPYFRDKTKWKAQIMVDGKGRSLGVFDTEEEAARAYDAAAYEEAGEFAWLNFPEEFD